MAGTSATLLAKRWESALLVNVDNETLARLMASKEAMDALMSIEGFRSLNDDLEKIINKSDHLKEMKSKDEKPTREEKKEMNCCEPICRGKLLLRRYHNRGAFLNLGEKNSQLVAAISVGMTVLAGLFFLSTFSFLGKGMLRWGLTMLLGGAFSNTYDRLKRKYVVDYVSFNVPWEAFRKIVFNIGDFAIMIGALVSVLSEV